MTDSKQDGPASPGTGSRQHQPGAGGDGLLAVAGNLSRYHREHEKYYSEAPLTDAIALQRTARTLIALAERWTSAEAQASELHADRARRTGKQPLAPLRRPRRAGRMEAKVKNGGRVLEPHKRCTRAVIPGWPGRARCWLPVRCRVLRGAGAGRGLWALRG
jgi:hypothetical protein